MHSIFQYLWVAIFDQRENLVTAGFWEFHPTYFDIYIVEQ